MPYFCDCGQKLDLAAALDAIAPDRMGRSGMFSLTCSGCGDNALQIRLGNGSFEVGYSYFGGSMHFEPVKRVSVKGLKIIPSDPDDLEVVFGENNWRFAIRHISTQRFCVFQRAFANGKRVEELDYGRWGVTLIRIQRNNEQIEFNDSTMIQADDFLSLSGMSPALTSFWHYLNNG